MVTITRRYQLVVALAGLVALASCGGGAAKPALGSACAPLGHSAPVAVTGVSDGLQLPSGSGPVGLTVGSDGTVWILATGRDRVYRIASDNQAEYWELPTSELGFQLSIAADGTAWIPERYRNAIASIAPGGQVSECRLGWGAQPTMTLALADGTVWVGEFGGNGLARLARGHLTEMRVPPPDRGITELAPDGAGGVWATESKTDALLHADQNGHLTEVSLNHIGATPIGILAASDKSIWVAEFGGGRIDHLINAVSPATFIDVGDGSAPQGLAQAADGTLWFTESKADRIGQITSAGTVVLKVNLPRGSWPDHLAIAPNGDVWWTEYYADRVARLHP